MLHFFRRKTPSFSPGSLLQTDMHSHLIPGIDDGARDMEASLHLLRGLNAMGYSRVITTPHIMKGVYSNSSTIIREGLVTLRHALKQNPDISLSIEAAAEYFLDAHFEDLLAADDVLSFGDQKYVLVEMSFVAPSPQYESTLFSLFNKGYTPVLAHPERYSYWHGDSERTERLVQMGCKLQVNLLSLTGYYGRDVLKAGEALVLNEMVHFLGTDVHHNRHLHALTHFTLPNKRVSEILSKTNFLNSQL